MLCGVATTMKEKRKKFNFKITSWTDGGSLDKNNTRIQMHMYLHPILMLVSSFGVTQLRYKVCFRHPLTTNFSRTQNEA